MVHGHLPHITSAAARMRATVAPDPRSCLSVPLLPAVAQHGVPARLVQDMFEQNKELFALPQEAKIAMLQDAHNRGYTPFAVRHAMPCRAACGALSGAHTSCRADI